MTAIDLAADAERIQAALLKQDWRAVEALAKRITENAFSLSVYAKRMAAS